MNKSVIALALGTLALVMVPSASSGGQRSVASREVSPRPSSSVWIELSQVHREVDGAHVRYAALSAQQGQLGRMLSNEVANTLRAADGTLDPKLHAALEQLSRTQRRYVQETQRLQRQMEAQDRQYATMSNVLKTKHDTAKNSIQNIR